MRQQDGVHIDLSGRSEADFYSSAYTILDGCSETEIHNIKEQRRAAAVMYGRCGHSGVDAGDGNTAGIGLWLIVSLVLPRPCKASDLDSKSHGGCGMSEC